MKVSKEKYLVQYSDMIYIGIWKWEYNSQFIFKNFIIATRKENNKVLINITRLKLFQNVCSLHLNDWHGHFINKSLAMNTLYQLIHKLFYRLSLWYCFYNVYSKIYFYESEKRQTLLDFCKNPNKLKRDSNLKFWNKIYLYIIKNNINYIKHIRRKIS